MRTEHAAESFEGLGRGPPQAAQYAVRRHVGLLALRQTFLIKSAAERPRFLKKVLPDGDDPLNGSAGGPL
jgi:hypothetical protein